MEDRYSYDEVIKSYEAKFCEDNFWDKCLKSTFLVLLAVIITTLMIFITIIVIAEVAPDSVLAKVVLYSVSSYVKLINGKASYNTPKEAYEFLQNSKDSCSTYATCETNGLGYCETYKDSMLKACNTAQQVVATRIKSVQNQLLHNSAMANLVKLSTKNNTQCADNPDYKPVCIAINKLSTSLQKNIVAKNELAIYGNTLEASGLQKAYLANQQAYLDNQIAENKRQAKSKAQAQDEALKLQAQRRAETILQNAKKDQHI